METIITFYANLFYFIKTVRPRIATIQHKAGDPRDDEKLSQVRHAHVKHTPVSRFAPKLLFTFYNFQTQHINSAIERANENGNGCNDHSSFFSDHRLIIFQLCPIFKREHA